MIENKLLSISSYSLNLAVSFIFSTKQKTKSATFKIFALKFSSPGKNKLQDILVQFLCTKLKMDMFVYKILGSLTFNS